MSKEQIRDGQGVRERNYAAGPGATLRGEAKEVALEAVHPNAYNYNAQAPGTFNKLVESMRTFGFTMPIIVRQRTKSTYEIIDGEHRWRAAKELGMPAVRVLDLGPLDDAAAKQLTIILNELGGQPDQVRLADLLREINADVNFADLEKVMPFSTKELSALLDSVDFSFGSLSDEDTRPKVEQLETSAGPRGSAPPPSADIPEEVLGKDIGEEDFRADMPTVRTQRITLHVPADKAKQLEMQLMQIDDDPVIAIMLAVQEYLAPKPVANPENTMREISVEPAPIKPKKPKSPRVRIEKEQA